MKIGNLHQHHDKLESFSAFASRTQSTFTLQKTHAFLNYAEFPAVFADFFKKILSLLLLPRETIASVMIYEEFFKSIHALDAERYAALKAIFAARGRPQILERRKIYVIHEGPNIKRTQTTAQTASHHEQTNQENATDLAANETTRTHSSANTDSRGPHHKTQPNKQTNNLTSPAKI